MSDLQSDILREWSESARYWQKHAATISRMFAPVTDALVDEAGIVEGHSVLDVAGGPGEPSLTIAQIVAPRGSVVCTDAVEEMMSAAKDQARVRGITNIEFRQCEAESLPFADDTFDEAVSRLGVMFFPDVGGAIDVRERILNFHIQAPISVKQFWELRSQTSGTLREKLAALFEEEARQVQREIEEAVAEFFPNDQMNFPAQMIIVTGTKRD